MFFFIFLQNDSSNRIKTTLRWLRRERMVSKLWAIFISHTNAQKWVIYDTTNTLPRAYALYSASASSYSSSYRLTVAFLIVSIIVSVIVSDRPLFDEVHLADWISLRQHCCFMFEYIITLIATFSDHSVTATSNTGSKWAVVVVRITILVLQPPHHLLYNRVLQPTHFYQAL